MKGTQEESSSIRTKETNWKLDGDYRNFKKSNEGRLYTRLSNIMFMLAKQVQQRKGRDQVKIKIRMVKRCRIFQRLKERKAVVVKPGD